MELLCKLYSIHSMSGQEGAMRNFVKKYVKDNIAGASVRQDHGNLYIVKGEAETYPCVVAHLDQVQTKHSPDFKVFRHGDVLFGFSAMYGRQEGLGADDKNGIWVALKCLERFDAVKVALFKEEEIGCGGSMIADMDFFADCRFAIQVDRRNGGDLITDICGSICSPEFKAAIAPYAKDHGYKETSGMMTDVETLSDNGIGLSCINMSCGYYNPHTDEEYTRMNELANCACFVFDIIENCTEVYPHNRQKQYYGGYGRGSIISWPGYSYGGSSKPKKAKDLPSDEGIYIPDFKNFADPEDAVYEFVWENHERGYDLYRIFDYIESDCETYGIEFEDYCCIVDYLLEDYAYDMEDRSESKF